MSLFVDTGVFFAAYSKNDVHHSDAVELIEWGMRGKGGVIYTSDYIFDETVTLARVKTHNSEVPIKIGQMIKDSPRINLLKVDEDIFNMAWDIFEKYCQKGLSFTDCTSIAIVKSYKIDTIFSFDAHFDGIINKMSKLP